RQTAAQALPDLYAGAPAAIPLALDPAGGVLRVRGRTADGEWVRDLVVAPVAHGAGDVALITTWARERVAELEVRRATGDQSVDSLIESLGLDFQVSTRRTAWVAISEQRVADPSGPTRRVRVPHALPQGM